MGEISSRSQMAKIRNFEKGYIATHLLGLGIKLGIFEILNQNPAGLSIPALAKELGLHEPYLRIFCQTAYHFEVLNSADGETFALQPHLSKIIGDGNHYKSYIANITMDVDLFGKAFGIYPDLYVQGKTFAEVHGDGGYTAGSSPIIYDSSKNIYLALMFMVLPKHPEIQALLEKGARILDVGCRRGDLVIDLAKSFAKCYFKGIDPNPHGIGLGHKTVRSGGLGDRVSLEVIGGESLVWKVEFDLAFMVVTLHEIPPAYRVAALANTYRAIKKGGRLVVLDFPYPARIEDFRDPVYDFAIVDQFVEVGGGSRHLSLEDQQKMLRETGFSSIGHDRIGTACSVRSSPRNFDRGTRS